MLIGMPGLQTALALRQAIWTKPDPAWHVCGIPGLLYSDHGSDFTSRHLEQVCADLHIQLVHSTPGMPRCRGEIERFFGVANELFLPGLPGHLVRGVQASPAKLTLAELDTALLRRRNPGPAGGGFTPDLRVAEQPGPLVSGRPSQGSLTGTQREGFACRWPSSPARRPV